MESHQPPDLRPCQIRSFFLVCERLILPSMERSLPAVEAV
jgi:hypothetical protein